MKKIILAICIIVTGNISVFGQVKKGAFLLGPAFNYRTQKTKPSLGNEYSQSNFTGNLKIGYFVTDKIAVGVVAASTNEISKEKVKNGNSTVETTRKNNIYGVGIFARAYKMLDESKLGFFAEIEALYQIGNSKTVSPNVNSTTDIAGFTAGLRPGVVYFITNKIGLEVSLGSVYFESNKYNIGISETNISTLNANFGFNTFFLGAKFYLGGK